MEKSVHTREYRVLLELLREARSKANLTQVALARRLGQSQSLLSKYERGEVRLDVIQLRRFCKAIDFDFLKFIELLERRLSGKR